MSYKNIVPRYDFGGNVGTGLTDLYTGGNKLPKHSLGGALSGAASGASIGSVAGPWGAAIGAVGGAVVGLIGGNRKRKAQEEAKREADILNAERQDQINRMNDQTVLSQYESYGVPISYYADGGTIDLEEGADYEVEGNEVVQGQAALESSTPIATDLQVATGPSHEAGGVLGAGGERVFSDRSKVDNSVTELLSELGIGKVKGKTYAEVAENIGKKKGKMEAKLLSPFTPSNRTAEKTLPRIDAALDILFESQESSKEDSSDRETFARGGKITKGQPYRMIDSHQDGGLVLPTPYLDYSLPEVDYLRGPQRQPTVADIINADNQMTETAVVPRADVVDLTQPSNPASRTQGFDWGNMMGQIGNLGSYLSNLEDIRNLDTSVRRTFLPMPVHNYVDRSGVERREVGRMVRTGQNALGSSSRTVNAANQAALIAQGLNANNQISQQENRNRDRYNQYYNDQAWRVMMANTNTANDAADQRRELENRKNVYMPQQARTAFMQGVMGNEVMRQQKNSDRDRLRISALLNDNNGVLSRAAEKLGYSSVDEYINALLNK